MGFFDGIIKAAAPVIGSFFGPVGTAVGTAVAGIAGTVGQEHTNQQNVALNNEQMVFNADQANNQRIWAGDQAYDARIFNRDQADLAYARNSSEAQKNRDFQETMANTQYQRAIGDLREAGLNPMLAYSQGGAPSPSGSMATAPAASSSAPSGASASGSAARVQNSLQVGLASAAQAAQIENMSKQGDNIDADTQLKKVQAEREMNSSDNIKVSTDKLREDINNLQWQSKKLEKEVPLTEAREYLTRVQSELTNVETALTEGKIDNVKADTAIKKVEELLKKYDVNEAKATSEKFGGEWGHDVSPFLKEALSILSILTRRR